MNGSFGRSRSWSRGRSGSGSGSGINFSITDDTVSFIVSDVGNDMFGTIRSNEAVNSNETSASFQSKPIKSN